LYLEDFQVGQRFQSRGYTLSEQEIKAFAAQFDPQPMHLDPLAEGAKRFGGLIASGWHTGAVTMRLLVDAGPPFGWGAVGMGAEITWPLPVRPGDTLHLEGEVIEVVPSRSRPDRGRVRLRLETRNQHGQTVQLALTNVLVPARGAAEPPAAVS
jgi:acyl dehydratase